VSYRLWSGERAEKDVFSNSNKLRLLQTFLLERIKERKTAGWGWGREKEKRRGWKMTCAKKKRF